MIKKRFKFVHVILGIFLIFCTKLSAEVFVFDNINIVPMDVERVLENHRVIVDGNIIVAIEPASNELTIEADHIIDARGHYMLPGLSDTHYHQQGTDPVEYAIQYKLLVANGVTSIRNMAEYRGQDVIKIRNHANKPSTISPFYYTTGPSLEAGQLKTPEDAVRVVEEHQKRGYDYIKVHGNFDREVYLTLLKEAQKRDIPVVGHSQRHLPLEYSLRMKSIAHVEDLVMTLSDEENMKVVDLTDDLAKSVAKQIKDSGIYVSSTLSIVAMIEDYTDDSRFEALKARPESFYLSEQQFKRFATPGEMYRSEMFMSPEIKGLVRKLVTANNTLTRALHEEGVPLLVGSDNFGFQISGFSIHDEMKAMVDTGIPAYEVLKAATITSARYLNRQSQAGTISVGKNAEFVILSANPLQNIDNTKKIEGVMLKGIWFDRSGLDRLLSEAKSARMEQAKLSKDIQ